MYSQPNTEQKAFRENLRALFPGSEIHHMFGRCAQVKIDLISTNVGHFAIIAMPKNHDAMIKLMKRKERRPFEKETWVNQMSHYKKAYGELPFGKEIYEAIRDYSV